MPWEVATPVFEGPLDLLLHLVVREEVDVHDVSIARIVDGYLAHLAQQGIVDLDAATEFLLVAATLVELKTRRLLPAPAAVDLDEELALWEERDLLIARLLACRTFRNAAGALQRLAEGAERSRPRRAGLEERFASLVPDVLAGVRPADLRAAFERAVAPRPRPRVELDHVAPIRASVRDAVDELVARLPHLEVTTFRRLTRSVTDRIELVVRFLAVLELFKEGLVDLAQAERFGELTITWLGGERAEAPASVEEYA